MRAQNILLYLLAQVIHRHQRFRRPHPLHHRHQVVVQRIIQCRIHAHHIALRRRIAADEARDIRLFAPIHHFAKREEILLPDAQRKLAHRVAKQQRQIPFQVAKRIDAKAVDIVPRNHVLIGADQEVLNIVLPRRQLLERYKIAHRIVIRSRIPLASKILILLQLHRPHQHVQVVRIGIGRNHSRGRVVRRHCRSRRIPPFHCHPRIAVRRVIPSRI